MMRDDGNTRCWKVGVGGWVWMVMDGREERGRWERKSNSVGKGNPTALGREINAKKQALRGVVIKPATALGAAAC